MAACRSTEGVFESLLEHIGEDGKISNEFLAEFQRQKIVGLPISKPPSSKLSLKSDSKKDLSVVFSSNSISVRFVIKFAFLPMLTLLSVKEVNRFI